MVYFTTYMLLSSLHSYFSYRHQELSYELLKNRVSLYFAAVFFGRYQRLVENFSVTCVQMTRSIWMFFSMMSSNIKWWLRSSALFHWTNVLCIKNKIRTSWQLHERCSPVIYEGPQFTPMWMTALYSLRRDV